MRYFIMKQDQNMGFSIKLRDFDMNGKHQTFYKEDEEKLNDVSILYIKGQGDEAFHDFIENPVYMVSDMVQEVLDMYEDELIFKRVVLINKAINEQKNYHNVLTDRIDGLSKEVLYYPDGTEQAVILDSQKVKGHHVFQLDKVRGHYLIVSLEVVESLLRRHIQGVIFKEVEVR